MYRPSFNILHQKLLHILIRSHLRLLKPSNTQSVINYKRHLRTYVDKHEIIEHATALQEKNINKIIFSNDYNNINKLDVLLTTGMIKVEQMIKKYSPKFPWSPILATSILDLSIWKIVKSEFKTNPVLPNYKN